MQCPRCKSKNLNFLPWLGLVYECRKCGLRTVLALEERKTKKLKPI